MADQLVPKARLSDVQEFHCRLAAYDSAIRRYCDAQARGDRRAADAALDEAKNLCVLCVGPRPYQLKGDQL